MKFLLSISILILLSGCITDTSRNDNSAEAILQALESENENKENNNDNGGDNLSTNREYWQKPDLVISKLGNLDGKVVADIGAGVLGYFSFEMVNRNPKKVIAIDIDPAVSKSLSYFREERMKTDPEFAERFEVRLATEVDSKLNENEVDIILIVNTIVFIENRVDYLQKLVPTLKPGGKVVIVDFKTKYIPEIVNAPAYEYREYLHVIEEQLIQAGFINFESDDTSLDYQYIITAKK